MRRLAALTALAGIGLLGAGCGDDSEPLTEEAFVEQANEICAKGTEELDALAEELGDDPSVKEIEEFFDAAVSSLREQMDDVDDLNPPASMRVAVREFLADARRALKDLKAMGAEAAFSEDAEDPFEELEAQATALGLDECS